MVVREIGVYKYDREFYFFYGGEKKGNDPIVYPSDGSKSMRLHSESPLRHHSELVDTDAIEERAKKASKLAKWVKEVQSKASA